MYEKYPGSANHINMKMIKPKWPSAGVVTDVLLVSHFFETFYDHRSSVSHSIAAGMIFLFFKFIHVQNSLDGFSETVGILEDIA